MTSYKIGKWWQGSSAFVTLQLTVTTDKNEEYKPKTKLFLKIDLNSTTNYLQLLETKPEGLKPSGNIFSLLRKYASRGYLDKIYFSQNATEKYIPLKQFQDAQPYAYLLIKEKPHIELSLIEYPNIARFRFSRLGTYTKVKTLEEAPQNWQELKSQSLTGFLEETINKEGSAPAPTDKETPAGSDIPSEQKDAIKKLKRRLKTLKTAYEKAQKNLPQKQDLAVIEKKATLLQAYSYLAKDGTFELKLDPALTGEDETLVIELDPDRSIGKNIENYFILLKKKKKALELGQVRLEKSKAELERLTNDLELLSSSSISSEKIQQTFSKYGIRVTIELKPQGSKTPSRRSDELSKYCRILKDDDGVLYLVGKGAKENDWLSKYAHGNDYWFHINSFTGSHIIVPQKSLGPGKQLTPKITHNAAMLAVHFSKARKNLAGEVRYTQKMHLKKPKGMAPGMWLVLKSQSVHVSYSQDQLKALLDETHNNTAS